MSIIIHDVEQGSLEWHELRKGKYTGSTAMRLLQGKPLPPYSEFQGNKHTKRGHILEQLAIREYERETGESVLRPGFITNSAYPKAGYSPDGIVGDTLLEVKCLNGERHEKLASGEISEIPLEYLCQIYFGMVICELPNAKLLAYNPEYQDSLTILDIVYTEKILKNIKNKLTVDRL